MLARAFQLLNIATYHPFRVRAGQLLLSGNARQAADIFSKVYNWNKKYFSVARSYASEYARALVAAKAWNELDALAKIDLHAFDNMRPRFLHDLSPLERRIFLEAVGVCESCQVPEVLAQLSRST